MKKSGEGMSEFALFLMFVFESPDVIKCGNTVFEVLLTFNRKVESHFEQCLAFDIDGLSRDDVRNDRS